MKKILIIADGILAKQFLEKVMESEAGENSYTIITYKEETLPKKRPENFKFFEFDPTSFDKLSVVLNEQFFQVMLLLSNELDAKSTYKNIRRLDSKVRVVMMDRWDLDLEENDDKRLLLVNSRDILASRFKDHLPNMPIVAQNIGLGIGEIMEVSIPVGSSYAYRHLASIEQSKWRIAAVYRSNTLLLPRPALMLLPNDLLLMIGEPHVLQSVFRSIKREQGQFPSPFGSSIYCLVDMLEMEEKAIDILINDALLLHSKLNSNKLHVKIINPTYSKTFEKIKSYHNHHINVMIDYFQTNPRKVLKEDTERMDIGLIVVMNAFFHNNKRTLFKTKLPVIKIGKRGFLALSEGVVLNSDAHDIEQESSVIFDVSAQLGLKLKLYTYTPDEEKSDSSLIEHFDNLSKIFGREVDVIQSEKNPLIKLKNQDTILQFLPFNQKVLESNIFSIFSTNMEKLHFKLADNYQLFIPVNA
ncbi:COG3400 family protein [Sulfurospirillum deleyianum]|uniref:TrkA-C domain protein n=1 Tax=Sulfurospirillum deleyianum (strain ATCC 51133 / DSM 6946 / 5175) TaxID=525898 RepID=D1B2G7_SULD5|nr:TrkA C-terminal domain-containing protein [Sulfurospirillum deleyianum]ACZ12287.1 TrkA-C domain protein [Sulfurospirillum deleyianum DSM 6946]